MSIGLDRCLHDVGWGVAVFPSVVFSVGLWSSIHFESGVPSSLGCTV